jgi:hypothetical protein
MIRRGTRFLDWERFGSAWSDTGLMFTTRTGLPVEPRNPEPQPLIRPHLC